jgi:hypothetical protein
VTAHPVGLLADDGLPDYRLLDWRKISTPAWQQQESLWTPRRRSRSTLSPLEYHAGDAPRLRRRSALALARYAERSRSTLSPPEYHAFASPRHRCHCQRRSSPPPGGVPWPQRATAGEIAAPSSLECPGLGSSRHAKVQSHKSRTRHRTRVVMTDLYL